RAAQPEPLDRDGQRRGQLRRLPELVLELRSLDVAVPDEAGRSEQDLGRVDEHEPLAALDGGVDRERDRLLCEGDVERGEEHGPVAGAATRDDLRREQQAHSGWSCQCGAVRAVRRYLRRQYGRKKKSQPAITMGIRKMIEELTKTISGTRIAATITASPSASNWWRLTRRSRPSYSSAGIWSVFHERPHC